MSERDLPRAVSLWIAGFTYDTIKTKTGLSKGTISNQVNDWKKKIPGLEELHEISRTLKKKNVGLLEVLRGARVLELINDLGVSLEEVPQCLEYFHAVEGRPQEIAAAGLRLIELEKKTGFSFLGIIKEYQKKIEQYSEIEDSLKALKTEKKKVRDDLSDLKKLEKLDIKFRELGLTPKKADKLLTAALSMEDIGFTPKTADILASEMKEVGLEPKKAAREIAKLAKKHGSLESAVLTLHRKEEQFKRQISTMQNEIDTLKKHRDGIQESINNREKSIENLESWYNKRKNDLEQEYYEKNNNLEREHAEKRKNLDTGYDLRKRSLNLEVSQLSEERDELQRNCDLLTETKMQHCEAFEFVAYTLHFLADREKVPTKIFENLIWRLNSIVERRRKGLITDWEEKKARSTILKGLMDYTDAVLKSEYDKIKEENDILTSPDPDRARLKKQMRRILGDMLPP